MVEEGNGRGEAPDPLPGVKLSGADESGKDHEHVEAQNKDQLTHLRVCDRAEGIEDKGHRKEAVNEMGEEDQAVVSLRVELLVYSESAPHAVVAASRDNGSKEHDRLLLQRIFTKPQNGACQFLFKYIAVIS